MQSSTKQHARKTLI